MQLIKTIILLLIGCFMGFLNFDLKQILIKSLNLNE